MIDIAEISTNLIFSSQQNIWFSKHRREVSYPKQGNTLCFDIEEQSFWYQHRNKCILEVVKRNQPKGLIFDIGGGNGAVSIALQRLGLEVYLVEPGLNGVLNAKKRGLENVICSALEDCGFKENTIPAVGIFDVLEHIDNELAFLETLKKILMKEGKLYITVPAYSFLWSKNDENAGHFRRYTLNTLYRLLSQIGFKVNYATYFFTLIPLPILLYWTIPSRLGIYRNVTPEIKRKKHTLKKRKIRQVVDWFLKRELMYIRQRKSIPIRSSCLVVCSKPLVI